MMDWLRIGAHALWVFGLAILLTTWSHYYWIAQETKQPVREIRFIRSKKLFFAAGMTFVGVGLALISSIGWQSLLWWAWAVYSAYKIIDFWRIK